MAEDFNVNRSAEVARLLSDVIVGYESFACHEWLEWGGSILFSKLMAEVELQERKLEESRKREEAEKERKAVVEARAEGFRERERALTEACHLVLGEFRVRPCQRRVFKVKIPNLRLKWRPLSGRRRLGWTGSQRGNGRWARMRALRSPQRSGQGLTMGRLRNSRAR
jgi:hypothetical protein